jgi:hypothetical protein
MNNSEHPKMIFRVPPDVKAWLAARAASNRRSMTGEVLRLFEVAMKAEPKGVVRRVKSTPSQPKQR